MRPYATGVIAAATGLAYVWLSSRSDAVFMGTVESWGARPGASTPISFVASPLLHASAGHLLFNLLLFLVFAPAVEQRVKGWGLALIYVLSGAAGVGAHLLGPQTATLIGASGAVSGVLGAHLRLRPWGRLSMALVGVWAALNLAGLLILDRAGARGISYLCHLAGLAAGALIAAALPSSRPAKARRAA